MLDEALKVLAHDTEYSIEYEKFVLAMSYAADSETPNFGAALEAANRLR